MRLIDKEALLAEYDRVHIGAPGGARKLIEDAPTIEPERKKGKWIDDNIFGQLPVIVCDQCKTFYPLQFGDSHNFCPNCGADMRERYVPKATTDTSH